MKHKSFTKRSVRVFLLAMVLVGSHGPGFSQLVASALTQQEKTPVPVSRSLKEVLLEIKKHYQVDIIYFDYVVDGHYLPAGKVVLGNNVEKSLTELLRPLGLRYKKAKHGEYIITRPGEKEHGSYLRNRKGNFPVPGNRSGTGTAYTFRRESGVRDILPLTDKTVRGTVTDENGEGLPGVSVVIKGSMRGAITDATGKFELTVPGPESVLIFSFVGYLSQEVAAGNRTSIDVSMQVDQKALEEVVVVGYGTQRKTDVTGSLTAISRKEFAQQPVTRLDQILQGRAPGVQVTNVGGAPGGPVRIRVRGANSILGDNNPLYVVDGFVGADFTTINPQDIETIQVLKDASSTAIYGSRGANGVIIITTKKGAPGGIRVNYSSQFSSSTRIKKLKAMTAGEFAQTMNERAAAIGGSQIFTPAQVEDFRVNGGTDWQDEMFTRAGGQEHQLGVSGGSDKTTFLVSANYLDQDGIIKNSNFKRYTLRSNVSSQITDKFSMRLNLTGAWQNNLNNGVMGGTANPMVQALAWAPTTPAYDANGNLTHRDPLGSIGASPLALIYDRENRRQVMFGNVVGGLRYELIQGLALDVQYAVNYVNQQGKSFNGANVTNFNPNAGRNSSESLTLQSTNSINYSRTLANVHKIDAVGVFETQEFTNESFSATGNTLLIPSLGYDNIGLSGSYVIGSEFSKWTLLSLMGRVNYSFKDKYLLSATVRRDGSSKFRGDNRYSVFPSVAAGWRISEEPFMQSQNVVGNLKLRASWGRTGSQAIGAYATQSTYSTTQTAFTNTGATSGIIFGNPGNPDLRWETTEQTDIGLEAEFLKGRIQLEADYFLKNTADLLLNRPLPGYVGGGSRAENVGVIENKGWELAVSSSIIKTNHFEWASSFNIANVKNTVKSVGGIAERFFTSSNVGGGMSTQAEFVYAPGQALGAYWGLVYEGTWKPDEADQAALRGEKPGDARYQDLNGDNAITAADFQIIGSGIPRTTAGWNNTFTYKGLTLNVFLQGIFGLDKLNYTRAAALVGGADARQPILAEILDRYIPGVNETSDIPAFSTSSRVFTQSTRFMEKGDFIRLKNVSLSYDLPKRLVNNFGVRLFLSGTNVFTITDYKGIDPESSNAAGADTMQGIDYGSYPNAKTYTLGVNLTF
ncbi:MAG: SusC/RagA family TonB-linked outer membrane protein [Cytophagaceae bacterium SCN 52-12]|nr:MAG: SusC/RagA family TonB-linked outer membrane protein [Cytophagaceae bacterium SCN 52-12]